jgi:hypothetical protein
MDDPITLFVIAGAGCFGGIATLRVVRSVELTAIQKVVLIVLAWIIPLIGAIIVMILTGREYMRRVHGIVIPRGKSAEAAEGKGLGENGRDGH